MKGINSGHSEHASQVRESTKNYWNTDILSVRHADILSAGSSFSQRSATALAAQAESRCSRNFTWRSESHSQDCPSFPIPKIEIFTHERHRARHFPARWNRRGKAGQPGSTRMGA